MMFFLTLELVRLRCEYFITNLCMGVASLFLLGGRKNPTLQN